MAFGLFQQRQRVSATVHDSLNADRIRTNAKQDYILACCSQPRFLTKLWEPVELRLHGDLLHPGTQQL